MYGVGEGQVSKYEKAEKELSATVLKGLAKHPGLSADYLQGCLTMDKGKWWDS
jgi:hypothetical protein